MATASNVTTDNASDAVNVGTWIPLTVVGILIVALNGTLCLAFATQQRLRRKSPNVLICSQAAADITNCILFIPFHTLERYHIDGGLTPFVTCFSLFLSLFSLFSLAIDRYLLIVKPIYHRRSVSLEKTRIMVLLVWTLPAVLSLLPLTWWFIGFKKKIFLHKVFTFGIWSIVVIMTLIMIAMYTYIFHFVKNYIKRKRETLHASSSGNEQKIAEIGLLQRELRVTRLFASLLLFFALVYTPIVYINFVILIGQFHLAPDGIIEMSLYLFVINSLANPILCLMLKKDYQATVLRMIGCQNNRVHGETTGTSLT